MKDIYKARFKESFRIKFLIGLITVILIVLMFPKAESLEFEVLEGSVWINDDLIAPFSYPILKAPDVYNKEVEAAKKRVFPVFVKNQTEVDVILDSLKEYSDYLTETFDKLQSNSANEIVNPTFLSSNSFNVFYNIHKQQKNNKGAGLTLSRLSQKAAEGLQLVFKTGVLGNKPAAILHDSIAIRTGNIDVIEPIIKFYDEEKAKAELKRFLQSLGYSTEVENALIEFSSHFVIPNIIYNAEFTNDEISQAQSEVSKYSGIVNENERIIGKHERVTKEAKLKIDSYRAAKGDKFQDQGISYQLLGKFLHIASLITLLTIYLFNFRKKIFYDNGKLLVFSILFIFISLVTYFINQIVTPAPLQYLIFVPAASMILTIIYDSRVGFYSTVIISLITAALRGNDYSFALMNLFAGALAVYTVRDIKNRSQIFRSFFFILIGYTIAVVAFGLERFASLSSIMLEMVFASSNAVISPVLTYGLLIFFEKIFNITTDLTLLELSNFDRPLLRDLSRKAQGTFNHSMTMGTIAEAAAEKTGANPLLARVGAYYHDIGKLVSPQNFVENQLNTENVHEGLTPEESVEMIRKHVSEGVTLGRKYNLPNEVLDFIPMHHGTMVIKFFYEKAKEKYKDDNLDTDEYRYEGPIPNTKETAIVMLADGCESAVRSIKEPDQEKIENVVDNIIKDRIESAQLNNSPLTLNDIDKIKSAFKNILIGQYHKRIRYPNQDKIEKKTNEEDDKK